MSKKRGRPIDPNAKHDGIRLRLSSEETDMLRQLSKRTGKSKTDILLEPVRKEMGTGK